MLKRRSVIALLIGVNLFLFGLLIAGSYSMPTALAQSRGAPGDFISVVATPSSQSYDVVYLLDTRSERLHALYPSNLQQRRYGYGGSVDLKKDFGE
ncbi:MAG: hypothetical protein IIB57_07750 [Planctomycetes bacterium]|nr:hypothetical protein [Planctomycetota bacterium]